MQQTVQISNNNIYLVPEVILPVFHKGTHKVVDKVVAGNGFTTAFSNIESERGCVDILVAPNVAVVKGKEEKYKRDYKDGGKTMAFVYGGSEVTDLEFETADIIFFVADSFLLSIKRIKGIGKTVRNICIDEIHSSQQQSSFRPNLKGFEDKVNKAFPNSAIVSVSATPNRYMPVDYEIINKYIPQQTIKVTNNSNEAIVRVQELLKKGKRVIVFSNNNSVFSKLKSRKKELSSNFVIGKTLLTKLSGKAKLEQDNESKLILASSRGFEGFDVEDGKMKDEDDNLIYDENGKTINDPNKKWNVFYFEDRNLNHERFYMSNLYQAINRTRNIAESIEYCRIDGTNLPQPFTKENIDEKVNAFISDEIISAEGKQGKWLKTKNSKRRNQFKEFVIVEFNKETKKHIIVRDEVAIALYKEYIDSNKTNFEMEFNEFFSKRGISFTDERTNPFAVKGRRLSEDEEAEMLFINRQFILDNDLIPFDYSVDTFVRLDRDYSLKNIIKMFGKHWRLFLNQKNYDGTFKPSQIQKIVNLFFEDDNDLLEGLVSKCLSIQMKSKKQKYNSRDYREYRKDFDADAFRVSIARMLLMLSNDVITANPNIVAHRDYNLTTEIGMSVQNYIAKIVGVRVDEFDIVSCNIRIAYALFDMQLPDNIYGVDKVNKGKINEALNQLTYNPKVKLDIRKQVRNNKNKLINLGIDEVVANFLAEKFIEGYASDFFNLLAYYESEIIREAMEYIVDYDWIDNDGVIRRHDSFLVYNNENDIDLSDWSPREFPSIKGWFLNDGKAVSPVKIRTKNVHEGGLMCTFNPIKRNDSLGYKLCS